MQNWASAWVFAPFGGSKSAILFPCIINDIRKVPELLKKDETKKYIEPNYKDKLFRYFNMSFKHLFKLPSWGTEKNSQKHLIETYALLDDYYTPPYREALEAYVKNQKEKYFTNFYKEVANQKNR